MKNCFLKFQINIHQCYSHAQSKYQFLIQIINFILINTMQFQKSQNLSILLLIVHILTLTYIPYPIISFYHLNYTNIFLIPTLSNSEFIPLSILAFIQFIIHLYFLRSDNLYDSNHFRQQANPIQFLQYVSLILAAILPSQIGKIIFFTIMWIIMLLRSFIDFKSQTSLLLSVLGLILIYFKTPSIVLLLCSLISFLCLQIKLTIENYILLRTPRKIYLRQFIQLIVIHKSSWKNESKIKMTILKTIHQNMSIKQIEQYAINSFGSLLEKICYYNEQSAIKGMILIERYLNGYEMSYYEQIAMRSMQRSIRVNRRHIYKRGVDLQILSSSVKYSNQLLKMIDKIMDEKIRFWTKLLQGYINMKHFLKEVLYLGEKIINCRLLVDKKYDLKKRMLQIGQSSDIFTLKVIQIYQILVFNKLDKTISQVIKQKLNYDDLSINDLSIWQDEVKILSMNLSKRVMKFENQMPQFLQSVHDQLVDDFICRNESSLFYNPKYTFYLDDNMFIIPCCINLCQPLLDNSLILYLFKRSLNLKNNYVLFTEDGRIHGMSETLYEIMDTNISVGLIYEMSNIQVHLSKIFDNFVLNQNLSDKWTVPINYEQFLIDKSTKIWKFINIQYQILAKSIKNLVYYYVLEIYSLDLFPQDFSDAPPLQIRQPIQYIPSDSGLSVIPDDLQSEEIESEPHQQASVIRPTPIPQMQYYNPPIHNNSSFRSQSLLLSRKPLFIKHSQREFFDQDIKVIEEEMNQLELISQQQQSLKEKNIIIKQQNQRDNHLQFTQAKSLVNQIQKIYRGKKIFFIFYINRLIHVTVLFVLSSSMIVLNQIIQYKTNILIKSIENISQPLMINHLFLKIMYLKNYQQETKLLFKQLTQQCFDSAYLLNDQKISFYFKHLSFLVQQESIHTPSLFRYSLKEFFDENKSWILELNEEAQSTLNNFPLFFFIISLMFLLPGMLLIIIQLKHWNTFSNAKYQILNLISKVTEWQAQNQIYKLTLFKTGLEDWKNTDFQQLSKTKLQIEEKVSLKKGYTNQLLNQRIGNHNLRSCSVIIIFTILILMLNFLYFLGYGLHMRQNDKYQPYLNINRQLVDLQFKLDNVIFLGDLIKLEPHYLNISFETQKETINLLSNYIYDLDENSILLLKDLSSIGQEEIYQIFNNDLCEQNLNLKDCNRQYLNRGLFGYLSTLTLLVQLEFKMEIMSDKYDQASWKFLNSSQHEQLFRYYYEQLDEVVSGIFKLLDSNIKELGKKIEQNLAVYYGISCISFILLYGVVVFKLIFREQKQLETLKQSLAMVPSEKLHLSQMKKQIKI